MIDYINQPAHMQNRFFLFWFIRSQEFENLNIQRNYLDTSLESMDKNNKPSIILEQSVELKENKLELSPENVRSP